MRNYNYNYNCNIPMLPDVHTVKGKIISGSVMFFFVKSGTNIDGTYFRDERLMKDLPPAIRSIANFIMKFTSFSKTMHRLVLHIKYSGGFLVRYSNSLLLTCNQLLVP